jgi:hypothetical protein
MAIRWRFLGKEGKKRNYEYYSRREKHIPVLLTE